MCTELHPSIVTKNHMDWSPSFYEEGRERFADASEYQPVDASMLFGVPFFVWNHIVSGEGVVDARIFKGKIHPIYERKSTIPICNQGHGAPVKEGKT